MTDIDLLYVRVWSEIGKVVAIHYDSCGVPEGAYFQDNGIDPPIIILCTNGGYDRVYPNRPSRRLASGDDATDERLLAEFITLAHEYGHVVSKRGRTPSCEWRRYRQAEDQRRSGQPIRRHHRELIVAEESLAWEIGRELLTRVGFDDWSEYKRRADEGVASYAQSPIV